MIGGEHKKERFSERLAGAQNQPKNRCYLPGTAMRTAGYSVHTLIGNWSEERADGAFYDGNAVLPRDRAKYWTTTYRDAFVPSTARSSHNGGAVTGSPAKDSFNQQTLQEMEDKIRCSYPGHQPQTDPQRAAVEAGMYRTVVQDTYQPPAEVQAAERAYVRPVLGGTPSAQATGVLQRLRRQLLLRMPGRSAFPGNVTRTVRHALQQCCHAQPGEGEGEVNVAELQEGLAMAGIAAETAECTALVRYFDCTGHGTASLYTIVRELRGTLSDRRHQLVRQLYALLESVSHSDDDSGEDGGSAAGGVGGHRMVRLRRMVELIDVEQLEAVRTGSVSAEAAREAFATQWDVRSPDAYINLRTFLTFFGDASFEIATDNEFERFVRNVWHLSGGNGKSMNTSCRRVEVVHLNGRITQEEIKDDLAIRGSEAEVEAAMRANLARQGIKDIKTMRVLPQSQ